MKTVFLAWEKYHARTTLLARALGAQAHYHYRLGRVRGWRLLLKYLWQGLDSVRLLWRERPQGVVVQVPPVFPALLAAAYAALRPGTRLTLDVHSGAFFSRKWAWSLPLLRWCARRAQLTVVHMPSLLPRVAAWGAPALELGYYFDPEPPAQEPYPLGPGSHIAVPSSFNADEPVALICQAAALTPDVHFHLTGDARRLPEATRAALPANVHLTGYLTLPAYYGLLHQADAVLALTTQDHTLQNGGAEAVWLGRPLIISDWPELQQVFAQGAVFVPHTPAGLAAGVRAALAHGPALQQGMRQLKRHLDRELRVKVRRMRAALDDEAALPPQSVRDWATDKES